MTFKRALELAEKNDPLIANHAQIVRRAQKDGTPTGCAIFSIGDEVFYYGFDGVDLHAGKHAKRQARMMISDGIPRKIVIK